MLGAIFRTNFQSDLRSDLPAPFAERRGACTTEGAARVGAADGALGRGTTSTAASPARAVGLPGPSATAVRRNRIGSARMGRSSVRLFTEELAAKPDSCSRRVELGAGGLLRSLLLPSGRVRRPASSSGGTHRVRRGASETATRPARVIASTAARPSVVHGHPAFGEGRPEGRSEGRSENRF